MATTSNVVSPVGAETLHSENVKRGEMDPALLLRQIFEQPPDRLTSRPHFVSRRSEQQRADQIENYTMEAVQAIRDGDVNALRALVAEKGPSSLDACNRNGETLIHLACRRGDAATVDFLLNEAAVPLFAELGPEDGASSSDMVITDDLGRSPLHDVCWRPEASPEIMSLVLSKISSPYALLQPDQRGHTPLDYVRQEHWAIWNQFLQQYESQLKRRIKASRKFQ
jgi:Ankyrin repeats (3 copies)